MPKNIFGYVKKKSTADAINHIVNRKRTKSPMLLVMTDASNAFHSLDHELVTGMLAAYNAEPQVRAIIKQYIKNRSQYVQVKMAKTDE